MVANDCSLVLHPPSTSTHSTKQKRVLPATAPVLRGDSVASETVQEVQQDLQPVAVVAAADQCEASRAWIDELSAVQVR